MGSVLFLLSRGRSVGEIAKRLDVREEAARAMIDHLVREGCLQQVDCEGCRFCTGGCSCGPGQRMFVITPRGRAMMLEE
ncbi:MAG: FeoC-like transcriptional regulator [Methanomassiliicoccales archaeon]